MGTMWVLSPKLQGSSFSVDSVSTGSGGWATLVALLFILICHCIKRFFFYSASSKPLVDSIAPATIVSDNSQLRVSKIVSDADLKLLIENLNENIDENVRWENVVDKRNNLLSYKAKCCKPKDGPLKYWSVTVFENCSPEILRDFYMDNDYRKQWDKTVIEHEQLQVDKTTGIEIGRTIKKFPLLTPREYVLAWKLWEGNDKSFYCIIKECEHPLAPPQKKYVRVQFFRSGWKIRKVPGRNASEILMFHQEDSGLNGEMAKLAFARGIWSYVCKMEKALCKFSTMNHIRASAAVSSTSLIQKVPSELDNVDSIDAPATPVASTGQFTSEARDKKLSKRPSRKLLANGLILLGGLVCLSRGHSSLGAKVAMAYILTKWRKHGASSSQDRSS